MPEPLSRSFFARGVHEVAADLIGVTLLLEGVGGRYFEDCNEAEVVDHSGNVTAGVAPYALDPANAERLWEVSLGLVRAAAGAAA